MPRKGHRDIAQEAGGRSHHPKGGEAHANYITYRAFYGYDYCKTQKPPLGQVTVSSKKLSLVLG